MISMRAQRLIRCIALRCPGATRGLFWERKTTFVRRRPSPALDDESDETAARLTNEMRRFMDLVAAKPPDPWFHRKSQKLVLAVVMLNVDGEPHFVPGINAEVSLPAGGSICAERSAIVAARAQFPGLSRGDFVGIAVCEVPLKLDWQNSEMAESTKNDADALTNPLRPCGACTEWLLKLQDANPDFRIVMYSNLLLEEIVECKPDGSRWEQDQLAVAQDIGTAAEPVAAVEGVGPPPKSAKLLGRLVKHWPPPGSFRRRDVLRRIPWFPIWWFEDLVKSGYLVTDVPSDPSKGTKYRLSEMAYAKYKYAE